MNALTKTERRLQISVDGHNVFANYRQESQFLYIDHVEAPPELRGKGAAGKLMQEISEYAKKHALELVPVCSYAEAWLDRNNQNISK